MNSETIYSVIRGYLACAEWADKPEGSNARFSAAARYRADDDCRAFIDACGSLADAAIESYGPERFGHDFWLTRNGHGAGFWDRNELKAPNPDPVPFVDRNGAPCLGTADTLGEALSIIARGNRESFSMFDGCDLYASRGWMYFA